MGTHPENYRSASKAWLPLSLLTIAFWGAWGLESKLIVDRISPWMNQVLFPLGLAPVMLWVLRSKSKRVVASKAKGITAALFTGILAGVGNMAFYLALSAGGKASIVTPLTCLFPVVTVLMAFYLLHESVSLLQAVGLIASFVSIYLLSA